MVCEAGKDIPGKGISMLRGEMFDYLFVWQNSFDKPSFFITFYSEMFLAGKMIIVNIGIGLYTDKGFLYPLLHFYFPNNLVS